jgi:hypothetical protein
MEELLSICVGIGLAAACGFRVFVPLLIVSIASNTGHLTLAQPFQWMGTHPALVTFSVATAIEVGGYYIPWVDNLLDTVATPAAVVAGTVVSASIFTDMSPFLKWTLAAIAGGGTAGVIQTGTVLARAASTAASGGLANALVATGELGLSLFTGVTSVLAWIWVLPVLALAVACAVGLAMFIAARFIFRRLRPLPSVSAPPVLRTP